MSNINFDKVITVSRLAIDGKFIYKEMSTQIFPDHIITTVFSNGNDNRLLDRYYIEFICTGLPYALSICTKTDQLSLGYWYVSDVQMVEKDIYTYKFEQIECAL